MISTANITMQFGGKPLFENVSVKFGDGQRYGLIGANGCGKSTLMKTYASYRRMARQPLRLGRHSQQIEIWKLCAVTGDQAPAWSRKRR